MRCAISARTTTTEFRGGRPSGRDTTLAEILTLAVSKWCWWPACLLISPKIILDSAVGRARAGCDVVGWQDALTQVVNAVVGTKLNVHMELQAETSGQLPNLGS